MSVQKMDISEDALPNFQHYYDTIFLFLEAAKLVCISSLFSRSVVIILAPTS